MSPEAWGTSALLSPRNGSRREAERPGAVGMLALGRQRAAELLEEARAEAEEIRRQAREEGRREGLEAGRAEARAELEQGLARLEEERRTMAATFAEALEQLRQSAASRWEEYLARVQADVLELALRICRRLVKRELAQDPAAMLPSIRKALQELHVREPAVVRVHPADYEHREGLQSHGLTGAPFRFEVDERVGPGGFLVESEAGTVDGRMESRLAFIRRQLVDGD